MPISIVDTHIHIWNLDYADYEWLKNDTTILNRSYHLDELEEERKKAGVTEGVLVQAANNKEDTDWMLRTAREVDWITGVVGWLPLMNAKATAKALGQYREERYFKGVRHLIHNEPDDEWLLQPSVAESLTLLAEEGLPFDVVGTNTAHIKTVLRLIEKVPALRMVFDHCNQPPIASNQRFGEWGILMKDAAQHEHCYAKISGLGTTAGKASWNEEDLKPFIQFTLENFGTERCFCGGDWPVSLLAGDYTYTWKTYMAVFDSLLTESEKEKVLNANAKQFYQL